jgi:hypothetical protein
MPDFVTASHCQRFVGCGILLLPPTTLQVAHTLFGYTKAELRGKNMNILLPSPISENHKGYIRSYISTGDSMAGFYQCYVACVSLPVAHIGNWG